MYKMFIVYDYSWLVKYGNYLKTNLIHRYVYNVTKQQLGIGHDQSDQ